MSDLAVSAIIDEENKNTGSVSTQKVNHTEEIINIISNIMNSVFSYLEFYQMCKIKA